MQRKLFGMHYWCEYCKKICNTTQKYGKIQNIWKCPLKFVIFNVQLSPLWKNLLQSTANTGRCYAICHTERWKTTKGERQVASCVCVCFFKVNLSADCLVRRFSESLCFGDNKQSSPPSKGRNNSICPQSICFIEKLSTSCNMMHPAIEIK